MKMKTLPFGLFLLASPALAVPDLEVSSVAGPPVLTAGDPLSLTWDVVNSGTSATPSGTWLDAVYPSSDPGLDLADLLLGAVNRFGILSVGQSYSTSQSLTLPPSVSTGDYFLLVVADALDDIPEADESNNVGVSSRVRIDAAVPEPSTLLLLGWGLAAQCAARRRSQVGLRISRVKTTPFRRESSHGRH
jgi:hypothetical protein